MVKILVDSTCDLTKELIERYNIIIVPLFVNFDEDSYRDGIDLTTEQLYEEVKKRKYLPKTSAMSTPQFVDIFNEYVKNGDEVIYTGISSQMSSSFNNARLAAQEIGEDKVFVVDSGNLSTGIGHLVIKAAEDRDRGLTAKEIVDNFVKNSKLVLTQFAIETMEYLHKGGRCSSVAKIAATLLRIKPIIQVRDGKMSVQQKPMGKIKVALDKMINQLRGHKDMIDRSRIFVTHSIAPESAKYILPILKEEFPDVEIIETYAGCVISSHCGPGCIGILYMLRPEFEDKVNN